MTVGDGRGQPRRHLLAALTHDRRGRWGRRDEWSDTEDVTVSAAFDGVGQPDFADAQIVGLDGVVGIDASEWVGRIFDLHNAPRWVWALFAVRAALVPLIGLRQRQEAAANPFAVDQVVGREAVVDTDAPHLHFRLGAMHGPVLRSMMRRAVRRA